MLVLVSVQFELWLREKGPNFTCIMAISTTRGILHSEFFNGGTRADHFNAFLAATVELAGNVRATFVMDNAPCHRRTRQVDIGNNAVRFLPAYSPILNIVEYAWSAWKAAFKQQLAEVRPQLLEQQHEQRMATLVQLGEQNLDVITLHKVH